MNVIKLDILVLMDRLKKVTAVAKAIGVKQPTVTFHMKSLEEQYGVSLFEHFEGRYELTKAGKALLKYAIQIRALTTEANRVMSQVSSPNSGILQLGASYVAGTYLLPQWIHEFNVLYPHVEIKLTIRTAPVIRQLLMDRQIDLGFISAQHALDAKLYLEPVREDRLVVAFSSKHPLAFTSQMPDFQPSPEHIVAHPFFFHDNQSTTRQMTDQWAQAQGVNLRAAVELDSLESIKRSLMLGHGITFISYMAIEEEIMSSRLCYFDLPGEHLPRLIYACYHQDRWLSPQMEAILAVIRG